MSVRAGIVVTGTEVLTGRITDRNGPWVSERLGELGVEVAHIQIVADRPEDLEAALGFLASEGIDLAVTTGGLGPTADDLTMEAVARATGRELVLDEATERRIAEIVAGFSRRFRVDPDATRDATRKQAMVPEGATILDPVGTAPGVVVDAGPMTVIVLPGPPRELQGMWPAALAAEEVRGVLGGADDYETATMRMFGLPESQLAKSLREIERDADLGSLEITTCLRGFELVIDVRHRVADVEPLEALRRGIDERLGRYVFSRDGSSVDEQLAGLLAGRRIGLGESCTGGLMAARLSSPPGASEYLAGGVVAYSNQAKRDLLGVPEDLLAAHGAVSPEVAAAMAEGAMTRFDADVGFGITGIAGPSGGTDEKPTGYVCFCAKDVSGAMLARDPVLPGGRADVRERSVVVALHILRRLLRREDLPV